MNLLGLLFSMSVEPHSLCDVARQKEAQDVGGPHRDTWPLISGKKRPKTSGDASVPRGTGMIAVASAKAFRREPRRCAIKTSTIPVARFIADARFLAARGSTNMLALLGGSSSAWSMRPSMASRPLFIRRLSSPPPRRLGMCAPQAPAHGASDDLRISPYWQTKLRELTRPAAVSLVPSLSTENALCYQNKKKDSGSLVAFADQEKEK